MLWKVSRFLFEVVKTCRFFPSDNILMLKDRKGLETAIFLREP